MSAASPSLQAALRGAAPLVVLAAAAPPEDCAHSHVPALLALLLSRLPAHRLLRVYAEALPAGLLDPRVTPTQPQRILCSVCFRSYGAAFTPSGGCDVCGGELRSAAPNTMGDPRPDAALLAAARADLAGAPVVLVLGPPRGAALGAIAAAAAAAGGGPRVLVGCQGLGALGDSALEGPAAALAPGALDCLLPGSLEEGAEAVADALGWRPALQQALADTAAAAAAQAGPPGAAAAAAAAPPPGSSSSDPAGEAQAREAREVQRAVQAALASAAAAEPAGLRALQALASGAGAHAEGEEDARFFLAGEGEGGHAAPPAPPAACFLYAEEEEGEGEEGEEAEEEAEEGALACQ